MTQMIEAVVIGNKPYHAREPDGRRVMAIPGSRIMVTPAQMKRFPQRLQTPLVADALAKAEKLVKEAQDAMAAEEAKALEPTPIDTTTSTEIIEDAEDIVADKEEEEADLAETG